MKYQIEAVDYRAREIIERLQNEVQKCITRKSKYENLITGKFFT